MFFMDPFPSKIKFKKRRKKRRKTEEKKENKKKKRTVFVRSCINGIRRRPITHACPSQNPNFIFGPTFEFVQNERRRIESNHSRLWVWTIFFHELQFVVDNTPIRSLCWRRAPCYSNCCRADRFRSYVLRWCSWDLSVKFSFYIIWYFIFCQRRWAPCKRLRSSNPPISSKNHSSH